MQKHCSRIITTFFLTGFMISVARGDNAVLSLPPAPKNISAKSSSVTYKEIPVTANAIPLNHQNNKITQVGALDYRGGLQLESSAGEFGGISSLVISPDGKQLLAISDYGHWLVADLVYDQQGHLAGFGKLRMAPLKNSEKDGATDPEAVTAVDGAGYVVAYESPHTLRYFQAQKPNDYGSLFQATPQKPSFVPPLPSRYNNLPDNLGIEALTTLTDGRLLAFSESTTTYRPETDRQQPAIAPGWIIGRGRAEALFYETSGGYRPTDMATMPNGDILVLERHFSLARGMAARLSRIARHQIRAGQVIQGTVIADLAFPFNLDNMEALAVRQNAAGEIMIYIMSDNNYSRLQRNLLMMFHLSPPIPVEQAEVKINGMKRSLVRN